jgi:HSP20 family protein
MAMKDLVKINGESTAPMNREGRYPRSLWESTDWMDRWFDNFFSRALSLPPYGSTQPQSGNRWAGFVPAVNVIENENEVRVTAELPGMDEKDIELSIHNGVLSMRGEKKAEYEENKEGYYRSERSYGTFHRSISLPEGVDPDKVEATFSKGVLNVTVPKLPESQTGRKKIAIKSESSK